MDIVYEGLSSEPSSLEGSATRKQNFNATATMTLQVLLEEAHLYEKLVTILCILPRQTEPGHYCLYRTIIAIDPIESLYTVSQYQDINSNAIDASNLVLVRLLRDEFERIDHVR